MLRFFNKLPDFNPVAAGVRASVAIPRGPVYREFVLYIGDNGAEASKADIIAHVEEIVLKINGQARWRLTGAELVMLNEYYGLGFVDGQLIIPLARPWSRTVVGEESLAWGTKNVTNMHMEVKFGAGATNPTLSADAWVTPEFRDLGSIVEVHSQTVSTSVAGKKEIPDLPKENGAMVAVHLANADITALEVLVNRQPFIENDTNLDGYERSLIRTGERVPQDGYRHIDSSVSNRVEDTWPLTNVQTFNVNPTVSAAGAIGVLMETLSAPLGAPQA